METQQAALAFAALGQETRLDLMRGLLAAGPAGLAAGDLALRLGVPPSTLSFHLRALEQAGLVAAARQGRHLIYAAKTDRLRALLAVLGGAGAAEPAMAAAPFAVLFLCTRNSARSIMAEAILNRVGGGRFRAFSAGSEPSAGGPMPEVLAQLSALGHDVTRLTSKSWSLFMEPEAPRIDFVIALCDILSGQTCPDFGAATITAAWPLPDPAKFSGSAAERAALLNELHAGLRRRIEVFASLPLAALDRLALKARLDELANPLRQPA